MRDQIYGTIQSAVCAAVEATGKRHQDVAEFLGIRGSTLSYGMEVSETRPGGLGVNYLHRLGADCPAAALPLAQHFAGLAGGVFQSVNVGGVVTSLYAQCGTVAKECGEAQAAIIRAAEKAGGHGNSARANAEALCEIDEAIEALTRARASIVASRDAA
ncbi:hypothetical protein [Alloyangia pacifica]|uniref:Uncharacterized protein n=1 Tax=Alloyangia pacifica TaxID=311180 RepID=A0A1I6QIQ4_9RHOB|nr:hypothetical protein [Alloyangia pacifica]SDF90838.1 hypothetical protein SAMN04488245_101102 [Alloyangia pacifica]SFS52349.1 hypothetical protein SAMN04488050_102103 [Alloyangia pacifica]